MKLIVTDMDGTLLNSKHEISAENRAALLAAEKQGIEIAIATGRTYGNALSLCKAAGLNPHIISNHGAFIYTNQGERILNMEVPRERLRAAVTWLADNSFYYNVCTDTHSLVPDDSDAVLLNDYNNVQNAISGTAQRAISAFMEYTRHAREDKIEVKGIDDLLNRDVAYGSILAISFCQTKLNTGRNYFVQFPGLAMTIAGRNVFEMTHSAVSKGNALECLTAKLAISMDQVMAIGDNYNDISMLEKAGLSVAVGNAEDAVKQVCKQVTLANDMHGVAYSINRFLNKI